MIIDYPDADKIPHPATLNAFPLRFEQAYYDEGGHYEMLRTKWVKLIGSRALLVPNAKSRTMYEIRMTDDGLIDVLKKFEHPDVNCSFNLIEVQELYYCFDGKHFQ